jgi:methylenetetrahydrofolate reductase (NADPH)
MDKDARMRGMSSDATIEGERDEPSEVMSSNGVKREVIQFAQAASTEISTHDEPLVPTLAAILRPGTSVYVAQTPKAMLEDVIRVAVHVRSFGLNAVPHIVARRVEDEHALREALRVLRTNGIEEILLVGGDVQAPVGRFASAIDIINTGALVDEGVRRVGVAGHPEGHRTVNTDLLWSALQRKQEFAAISGIKVHIVTQFGFNQEKLFAWAQQLAERGIKLPVHVGFVGPTPFPQLVKFALRCGVGVSMRFVMNNLSVIPGAGGNTVVPDEMMLALVRRRTGCLHSQIVRPHLYSLGGSIATARWLRAVMDGHFDIESGSNKFAINA